MKKRCSRREFLQAAALAMAAAAAGCAVNPVSGRSELMLMSRRDEIAVDRQNAPYQFAADYGVSRDAALNAYLRRVGGALAAGSHRPDMPYSFQCVNAVTVNAYAFPGGTIAVTRGILVNLGSEAELAALLGHEIGHVNARHTARQMSKNVIVGLLSGAAAAYAGSQNSAYARLAAQLGALGGGALLASYSRDNEREADALAMEYMVRAGYNPQGEVLLMDMLRHTGKRSPSAIELMFATHPMSSERYQAARARANGKYKDKHHLPLLRERYMDNTARLRAKGKAIMLAEKGRAAMGRKDPGRAVALFKQALEQAKDDYAIKVMMAKALMMEGKTLQALAFAKGAKHVHPGGAQALLVCGLINIDLKRHEAAHADFTAFSRALPGSPVAQFYLGLADEGMNKRAEAAGHYRDYLGAVREGEQARHAYKRLKEWGYIR